MTTSGFARALPRVLVHEGGYVNHPDDPGGATNKGITFRVYDAFRARKGLPPRDVRQIDDAEVSEIYREQYWDAVKGDELPAGLDYVLFDGAVNSGPKQSIKWLQRALGFSGNDVDGVIGLRTLKAVQASEDNDGLIAKVIERRRAFLRALRTYPRFGKGWERRIANVQKVGQLWASGPTKIAPMALFQDDGAYAKAPITDAAQPPRPATGDLSAGSGGLLGTITGIVHSLQEQLIPFTGSELVANVVLGLGAAATVLAVAGIGYGLYARWKKSQAIDVLDLYGAVA